MTDRSRTPEDQQKTKKPIVQDERWELLENIQAILEPVMVGLGLVFLGLLLIDYSTLELSDAASAQLDWASQVIWGIFLVDFAIRFLIAPAKLRFLRGNWLVAVSLALPFLRPFRALRAARALRSLSLVRLLAGINRGIRVLRAVTRGRQFAFVGFLTILVMLTGALGALFFERGVKRAPIQSFSDALWWSAAMVTTINNEKYVVSGEARILAILIRIFAVSIFGYVTASIATYLIGSTQAAENADGAHLGEEIAALRRELVESGLFANQRMPKEETDEIGHAHAGTVGPDDPHQLH